MWEVLECADRQHSKAKRKTKAEEAGMSEEDQVQHLLYCHCLPLEMVHMPIIEQATRQVYLQSPSAIWNSLNS